MNTDTDGPRTEVVGDSRASARRRMRRRAGQRSLLDVVVEGNQALMDLGSVISLATKEVSAYPERSESMSAAETRAFEVQTRFMAVNVVMLRAALNAVERAMDEALLQASPDDEVAAREQVSQTHGPDVTPREGPEARAAGEEEGSNSLDKAVDHDGRSERAGGRRAQRDGRNMEVQRWKS